MTSLHERFGRFTFLLYLRIMIFYFSGTGNTKWTAEQLAQATGEELRYIPDEMGKGICEYTLQEGERLGFCFPTHGWQPPKIVRDFIRKCTFKSHANAVFAIIMPESNVCFSFLHLDAPERETQKIEAAKERMRHVCEVVARKDKGVEELVKGAIPYTYTYIIGGYYNKHLINDKSFWVDEDACVQCGLCQKLCPVNDIEGIPPTWKHNGSCTNCLSCYHHCPKHAIHWGKMKRGQYVFKKQ